MRVFHPTSNNREGSYEKKEKDYELQEALGEEVQYCRDESNRHRPGKGVTVKGSPIKRMHVNRLSVNSKNVDIVILSEAKNLITIDMNCEILRLKPQNDNSRQKEWDIKMW